MVSGISFSITQENECGERGKTGQRERCMLGTWVSLYSSGLFLLHLKFSIIKSL